MRKHSTVLAVIAALLVLIPAPSALAHAGGNPNYRSVIDRVTPNAPGVHFEVLAYDAYFELRDQHGHEVLIYGYEGEPYARVLKDGTVQVNERSPAYYLNDTRYPTAEVPAIANPKAPPKWKAVGSDGTFLWHDHRMHYGSTAIPPQVTDQHRKTKVYDYEIPLRIDGQKGAIDGTLYWVGSPNPSKLPFIVGGAAFLVVGGALVLFLRRRRGSKDESADEPAKEAW
ncbi:MAG TPA: hypothetical protein VHR65_05060 [Solirubrobacterales bacterium]|nr:hypothetical protein [Solirubrobacterales bacterium]